MNATMFAGLKQAAAGAANDQKMDQVRELLFGEFRRSCEARLLAIEAKSEAFEARLANVEAKLSALAASSDQDRRALIDDLAKAVGELSGRIGAIANS